MSRHKHRQPAHFHVNAHGRHWAIRVSMLGIEFWTTSSWDGQPVVRKSIAWRDLLPNPEKLR